MTGLVRVVRTFYAGDLVAMTSLRMNGLLNSTPASHDWRRRKRSCFGKMTRAVRRAVRHSRVLDLALRNCIRVAYFGHSLVMCQ